MQFNFEEMKETGFLLSFRVLINVHPNHIKLIPTTRDSINRKAPGNL